MKNKENIMVSICCTTYNHAKYIKQALDGFVMQKTDFKYEILVYDDCSLDGNIEIIREYEKKYPELFDVIIAEENYYSKGIKVGNVNYRRAKGKYIAVCEGDDYWTDPYKLQKQYDYMEANDSCTICFHNARIIDMESDLDRIFVPYLHENKRFMKKNNEYNMGEVELLGFIPTASLFFRAKYIKEMPDFMEYAMPGDSAVKLFLTSQGYAYMFSDIMSVYRVNSINSIMKSWAKSQKDIDKKKIFLDKVYRTIEDFNKYTDYKYNDELDLSNRYREFDYLYVSNDKECVKNKRYKICIKSFSLKRKIAIYLKFYFPFVFKILRGEK